MEIFNYEIFNYEIFNYEILIDASPEKVWQVLWDAKSYTQWRQYFSSGSTVH